MNCCTRLFILPLESTTGYDIPSFPVIVYNADKQPIGVADNVLEYMQLWNSDPVDAALGKIVSGLVTTNFLFTSIHPISQPPTLWADPAYLVITPNNEPVLNSNGDYVRYQN